MKIVESALERVRQRVRTTPKVGAAMQYALDGGGKRLRPALCLAVYEAVSGRTADNAVAELAAALELIHTYSLVHDDLPCMDNDDMRRGRATVHRVFGDDAAVLAGAALIPLAFATAGHAAEALGLAEDVRREIATALARAAGAAGMVGGQVMDLEGEARALELGSLEAIHAAKTGALLRGACLVGAIAGGAARPQLAAIDRFGGHLGLAFQITDDVLDETASTAELGKTAGKDRSVAKATYPALLGIDGATARAQAEAEKALAALGEAGIATEALTSLARFAVERKR